VQTVSVFPLRLMVPLVCVKVRVAPIVRLSTSTNVPPEPLNVSGKSKVFPLVVMFLAVALVDLKDTAFAPAAKVMPDEIVRSPKISMTTFCRVPVNAAKKVRFR